MTFTKTSQKFGQWSDVRANTVYGLGFSSEVELNKVIYTQGDLTPIFPTFSNLKLNLIFYINADPGST